MQISVLFSDKSEVFYKIYRKSTKRPNGAKAALFVLFASAFN